MNPGDRVVVVSPRAPHRPVQPTEEPFAGWATVVDVEHRRVDTHVAVHFDAIPPNNTYYFPNDWVRPLYVIGTEP